MTSLPYKYNSLEDYVTADQLKTAPIAKYLYFTFNYQEPFIVIGILKKLHMITDVIIAVEQGFVGSTTPLFNLFLKGSNEGSIANGDLRTVRTFRPFTGSNTTDQDMLRILTSDAQIQMSINGTNLSRGKGWGLITYLDMAQVPGYRRL